MANKTQKWQLNKFTGGLSQGTKSGLAGSFRDMLGIDYRTDPDMITSTRALKKDSGTTVVDLVKWVVENSGDKYMYGDAGHLYKKSSAGTYSDLKTVSDSHGNGIGILGDYLYYASDKGIGRYGVLSGTPAFEDDFLVSPTSQSDQYAATSGSTYTLTTAINEGATHRKTFIPTVDNINGIALYISGKGTGNWTITVHDASNNLIGAKTVANADLVTGMVRVMFSGAYDLTIGNSYHFHVHSTVADGTLLTTNLNDLETVRFTTLQYITAEDVDQFNDPILSSDITGYTILTSLSEAAIDRLTFIPDKTTQTAIAVVFRAINGTTTITIHDDQDKVMASVVCSNLRLGAINKCVFTTPWTAEVGATYHAHIVSTAAGAAIESTSTSMEDITFKTYYQILENNEAWHPMMYFPAAQGLLIGNGRFCAFYDGIVYRGAGINEGNERLVFSKEESVRALATVGDYAAIATTRGSNIYDHGESTIYFWDGVSPSYNNFKTVVGEVNAMTTGTDGLLYVIHSGFGYISIFDGSLTLVHTIPLVGENKYIETYPGAITNWNSYVMFGISNGDSTTVDRVVYSYGRKSKSYPRSLDKQSAVSTGNKKNTIQIGCVKGIGPAELYVSWKDNTTYGVDIIDTANDQATSYLETRIFDAESIEQEKKSYAVKLIFEALTDGQTIEVQYKKDRASSWTSLGTATYASTEDGAKIVQSFAFDERWHELELKFILTSASGNAPKLLSATTYFEIIDDIQE